MKTSLHRSAISMALLLSLTACGDDGDVSDDAILVPDGSIFDGGPSGPDAMPGGGNCAEFEAPAMVVDSYPAEVTGNVVGAGADLTVGEGICADERTHYPQEGEDQVVRLDGLVAGTTYAIDIASAADIGFYVATDCTTGMLLSDECLLFVDEEIEIGERGDFVAPAGGSVFVVIDHFQGQNPLADGAYTLSVFEPDCIVDDDCAGTPDTPLCSNFTCVGCTNSFQCDDPNEPICDVGGTNTCAAGYDTCTGDDPSPPESSDDGPSGAVALDPDDDTVDANICSDPAAEADFYSISFTSGETRVLSVDWTGTGRGPGP